MKQISLFILLLMSGFCMAETEYLVTAKKLNIRSLPSIDSEIIGSLSQSAKINVYIFDGDWAVIAYHDGVGYVSKQWIKPVNPVAENIAPSDETEFAVSTTTPSDLTEFVSASTIPSDITEFASLSADTVTQEQKRSLGDGADFAGIGIGYAHAFSKQDPEPENKPKGMNGVQVSISSNVVLGECLGLYCDFGYMYATTGEVTNKIAGYEFTTKTDNHYIHLDLHPSLNIGFTDNVAWFVHTGLGFLDRVGIEYKQKENDEWKTDSELNENLHKSTKRADCMWGIGTGMVFGPCVFSFNINFGMVNQIKDDKSDAKLYNRNLNVSLVYSFM